MRLIFVMVGIHLAICRGCNSLLKYNKGDMIVGYYIRNDEDNDDIWIDSLFCLI